MGQAGGRVLATTTTAVVNGCFRFHFGILVTVCVHLSVCLPVRVCKYNEWLFRMFALAEILLVAKLQGLQQHATTAARVAAAYRACNAATILKLQMIRKSPIAIEMATQ